jgi:hypothetical protein
MRVLNHVRSKSVIFLKSPPWAAFIENGPVIFGNLNIVRLRFRRTISRMLMLRPKKGSFTEDAAEFAMTGGGFLATMSSYAIKKGHKSTPCFDFM